MKKIIDLQGVFSFRLDNEKEGITSHFEAVEFSDTITLPTTTSEVKKGTPTTEAPLGYLTDLYGTEGYAWYKKELSIEQEDLGKQFLLLLERTRISHIWIDDSYVGTCNSLCTSHHYDLSNYITKTEHTLTIMTSNTDYPVKGGHMTSPDTQTNWNGILGNIQLQILDGIQIKKVTAVTNYEDKSAHLQLMIQNNTPKALTCSTSIFSICLTLSEETEIKYAPGSAPLEYMISLHPGENNIEILYPLGKDALYWDEFNPCVYEFTIEVTSTYDKKSIGDYSKTYFGLKKMEAKGTHFYINDRKTFLRGKHDGMIFPLTGYAPMDTPEWLRVMKIAQDFGINHYRYHTSCPPNAAFEAADLLGIYMEPELPFWGTFTAPGDEGHDEIAQSYLIKEGFRILDEFGHHPSFVMMSMGNELWGSPESINELLGRYKAYAPHILFTQGSNNFQWVPNIQPNDDFFCGVRFTIDRQIRGSYAMCDRPLGHVQTMRPGTLHNYQEAIFPSYQSKSTDVSEDGTIEIQYGTGVKRVKLTDVAGELIPNIPVVSHEIGQYETFPDFREIDKYTGVLKARNFEQFRDALEKKNLLPMAQDYFKASGKLAAACYKDELETALRTKDMAGFQILDLQDFSGQGTALVGMLDAFMDNKGILSPEEWRTFCSETVLQAEFPTYVLKSSEPLTTDLLLTYYGNKLIVDPTIICTMKYHDKTDNLTHHASLNIEQGLNRLGSITITIPEVTVPEKCTLTLQMEGMPVSNSYDFWIYPEIANNIVKGDTNCSIISSISDLTGKGPAILLLDKEHNPNSIEGTYCTDFWCYPMFRGISEWMKKEIPVGTMGLLIRNEHPALEQFPSEYHSTPQWWDIVMNSRSTILDHTDLVPIVQTIDNFERNHRLGLIYELRIKETDQPVLICTSPLVSLMEEGRTEAAWLLHSLTQYVSSSQFAPDYSMSLDDFTKLFAGK